MKTRLLKFRCVFWLLVAVLAAVATLGLTSVPASAQDKPQWPVSVEGTNYGSVFDRNLASSEAGHLLSLKMANERCNKVDYDLASILLWGDYLAAKARYEKFQQQRTFNKKLRSVVWGGQDVFARQDARLKHDMDEALKIYNERPLFQCAVTPLTQTSMSGASIKLGTGQYALSFSTGSDFMHYSSSYRSTGTQAPLDASSSHTSALICGGVNGYWPMPGLMPSGYQGTVGGGINICGVAGGKSTLYSYYIHPGNGAVTATVDPGARVEAYLGYHWDAFGPERTNPYIYMRYGPVFAQNKISVTSNQTGAGGRFESADRTVWTTGVGVELGLSSPLCPSCAWGKPLRWTVSGKGYWFGSGPSVSVTSSAFGFTEKANISRSSEYSLNFGLSMAF
jgi:hypothetical protein